MIIIAIKNYAGTSMHIDSEDPNERTDFIKNGTIEVTILQGEFIQNENIYIPLVNDDINEANEGFLVIVDVDKLRLPEGETLELVRDGITLVNIMDDDRKQCMILCFNVY